MEIHVNTSKHGPMFDGSAPHIVSAYIQSAVSKVGGIGKADVDTTLRQVLRNPTGNYQAHINTRELFQVAIINDGRIIYGGWLEGTSRRNATTRFKGYHTFRLVVGRLREKAPVTARLVLDAYVRRLNG